MNPDGTKLRERGEHEDMLGDAYKSKWIHQPFNFLDINLPPRNAIKAEEAYLEQTQLHNTEVNNHTCLIGIDLSRLLTRVKRGSHSVDMVQLV